MALPKVQLGQIWEVNFESRIHTKAPGKRDRTHWWSRPIVQTHILNGTGHGTTIVIPGETQVYRDAQGDGFPLRLSLGKLINAKAKSDLLIDQIRTSSNQRLIGDKAIAELWLLQI